MFIFPRVRDDVGIDRSGEAGSYILVLPSGETVLAGGTYKQIVIQARQHGIKVKNIYAPRHPGVTKTTNWKAMVEQLVREGKASPVFFKTDIPEEYRLGQVYGIKKKDGTTTRADGAYETLRIIDREYGLENLYTSNADQIKYNIPFVKHALKNPPAPSTREGRLGNYAISIIIADLTSKGLIWIEMYAGVDSETSLEGMGEELLRIFPPKDTALRQIENFLVENSKNTAISIDGNEIKFMGESVTDKLPNHQKVEELFPPDFREFIKNPTTRPLALMVPDELKALEKSGRFMSQQLESLEEVIWIEAARRLGSDLFWGIMKPIYGLYMQLTSGGGDIRDLIPMSSARRAWKDAAKISELREEFEEIWNTYSAQIYEGQYPLTMPEHQSFLYGEWYTEYETDEEGNLTSLPTIYPTKKGAFWYIWKETQIAAEAWNYYLAYVDKLIEKKILDNEALPREIKQATVCKAKPAYAEEIPMSSIEAVSIVNQLQQELGLVKMDQEPEDMYSSADYAIKKDLLFPWLPDFNILDRFLELFYKYYLHTPHTDKWPYLPDIYMDEKSAITRGSAEQSYTWGIEGAYTQATPPVSETSIESGGGGAWGPAALLSLAMYGALPEQETQTGLTSPTPAGGDGVLALPVGGTSSLSLPSFPSVSFPGLGTGPLALPSPVGLGGGGGGVLSKPSVGLPSMGWDGAAMPASSVVPAGGDGAMASGGYFLGGLKQLVAGQEKPRGGVSPALNLGAFLLAPFKNLLPSQRPSAPGSRGGRFTERLFQIPQMLLSGISLAGPSIAAEQLGGGLFARLLSPRQPQISAPQIVHRFEKGSVQIHTQKIDSKTLGDAFISFLAEQSRQ